MTGIRPADTTRAGLRTSRIPARRSPASADANAPGDECRTPAVPDHFRSFITLADVPLDTVGGPVPRRRRTVFLHGPPAVLRHLFALGYGGNALRSVPRARLLLDWYRGYRRPITTLRCSRYVHPTGRSLVLCRSASLSVAARLARGGAEGRTTSPRRVTRRFPCRRDDTLYLEGHSSSGRQGADLGEIAQPARSRRTVNGNSARAALLMTIRGLSLVKSS